MPIQPNFLERTAFFTLNAAPAPMLDLAGALAFQAVSTAVHLDLFTTLHQRPSSAADLAQRLDCQERGLQKLLSALAGIGYVTEKDGRYHITPMTEKWFLDGTALDLVSAVTCWGTFLQELWPLAPGVIQSGERPYNFYDYIGRDPALSHAFQQMMVGNANIMGPDIVKKVKLPPAEARLLDVGGGHGMFTVQFCRAHPQVQATIVDSAVALETAEQHVAAHQLGDRIELKAADIWQMDWGQNYDLILLFNFIHHYDIDTNLALLQKAHAALKPGGQVAILDQLEGNISGSAINAIVQLIGLMYYLFADGRTFSRDEASQMLTQTGFSDIQFHSSAKWSGTSLATAVA